MERKSLHNNFKISVKSHSSRFVFQFSYLSSTLCTQIITITVRADTSFCSNNWLLDSVYLFSCFQLLPLPHVITVVLSYFYIASFCIFCNSKGLQLAFSSLSRKPVTTPCPTLNQYVAGLILNAAESWK